MGSKHAPRLRVVGDRKGRKPVRHSLRASGWIWPSSDSRRKDQECRNPPTLPEIQLEHTHGDLFGAGDVGDRLVITFPVGGLGSRSPVLAAVGHNHRLEYVVVQRVNHRIEGGGRVFVSRGDDQAVGLVL